MIDYKYRVMVKVLLMLLITVVFIPAYFYYGGTLAMALLFTVYGIITNALAQIAYHRWLAHEQFTPNIIARYAMIFSTVICGNGNHLHNVYAHLNHHKHSDKEKDTHNPKELGFFKMWLGLYKTPSDFISLRKVLKHRDVVFVSNNYWKIYILISCVHLIISPWLLVWQAFNFTHMWFALNWLNYDGHRNGAPSKIRGFVNVWIMGEGNHDVHHRNSSLLDMTDDNNIDWGGRYIIPYLLAK